MEPTRVDNADGRRKLHEIVRSRDLILVTGKGGVGKSTMVAALARLAASQRGGALAIESSAHPRLHRALEGASAIRTLNIEAETVLPQALARLLRMRKLLASMLTNRLMRLFIRTAPAVSEMIVLDEIEELVRKSSEQGIPVIVDLPATGHALTMLDAPRSVREMLRVGPLAAIAKRVEALLLDRRRTELVVVALPAELPVNETIDLVSKAHAAGYSCQVVLVNRVPSELLGDGDQPLLELMEETDDHVLTQTARAMRQEHASANEAREQIERLRDSISQPLIELPVHIGSDPRQRAEQIARSLGGHA